MIANFCFSCDKELKGAFGGSMSMDDPQCADALVFTATGNYGSRIFDSFDGRSKLTINICDECVLAKRDRVLLARIDKPLPVVSYEPWDPEKDY